MIKSLFCFYGKPELFVRNLTLCIFILSIIKTLYAQSALAEIYGSYVGAQTCNVCHSETVDDWRQTSHAKSFTSLEKSKQQDLPDCLQCHVVGYGRSGGFLDRELTIELAGIQCENSLPAAFAPAALSPPATPTAQLKPKPVHSPPL